MTTATLERSFVFYQSFHDMITLIPDSETQLAAYGMICAYALEGTEPETDNWILNLLFYAVKPLIDSNRKRRENGKKGGRKPAATEMQTETVTEVQADTTTTEQVTEEQKTDIPGLLVYEIDKRENMVCKEDIPKILVKEEYCQEETATESPVIAPQTAQPAVIQQEPEPEQTPHMAQNDILLYGENKYPVTQMELKKIQNLARKLFKKHNFGRILNEFDIDKIMKYTVARREINGVAVGVLDRDKTDLLEYAVEQAEAAEKLNWRYIEGIYRNFLLRDIKTADEAYQYDLSRSIPALQL